MKCPLGCELCFEAGCLKCNSGLYQLNDACYDRCPIGYEGTLNSGCVPAEMSPPVPVLTVLDNNVLSVSFDKPMNFTLSASDFSVDIVALKDEYISVTWSDPFFEGTDKFTVALKFYSSYLPADCNANFTFLTPIQVLSAQLVPLDTPWLIAQLHAFGTLTVNSTTVRDSAVASNTAAAAKGAAGLTAITSMGSGPGGFISFINQLQLIAYLSMTKIDLPQEFAGTISALNVGLMLPNPLDLAIQNTVKPPDSVANYGINTVLFLPNTCTFLVVTSAILASYLPTWCLSRSNSPAIASYCKRRMKSLTFSTPILAWFTSYLDLTIFSLLQVTNLRESLGSGLGYLSVLTACLFLLLTCVTPIALVTFTIANRRKMVQRDDQRFNDHWGVLYMNFADSDQVAIPAFYCLFVIRRLVLAVTAVLFPSSTKLFAVLNPSFAFMSALYMVIIRPFAGRLDHIEAVTTEIGTTWVYIVASSFAFPLSVDTQKVLGEMGIWSIRAVVAANSLFSLLKSGLAIAEVVKEYKMRVQKAKYKVKGRASAIGHRAILSISTN